MKLILKIVKKELTDIFRDRASLYIFLIPLVCFPMLSAGLTLLSGDNNSYNKTKIAVEENINCGFFYNYIYENDNIKIIKTDNPYKLLNGKKVDCIALTERNTVRLVYNSHSCKSLLKAASFGEGYEKYINSINASKYDNLLSVSIQDEKGNTENQIYSMLSILSPCIFILFLFQGNTLFANDLFAGEKERKTFEMLLLSVKNRQLIYIGKVITLIVTGTVNSIFCLISYIISELIIYKDFSKIPINKNIIQIAVIIILLEIISSLTSATVSLLSKNLKQAQMLNEMTTAIPTLLCITISLGFASVKNFYYAIPVVSLITLLADYMNNEIKIYLFLIGIIVNLSAALFIYFISKKLINSEKICL